MAVQIFKSFNSASSKSIIHISDWIDENWQNWKLEEISNFTDWVSFDQVEAE